jgi:hypothetical protein
VPCHLCRVPNIDHVESEDTPKRACNECGAQMKHLADLPRKGQAARRIFRCYNCNNVVSELL